MLNGVGQHLVGPASVPTRRRRRLLDDAEHEEDDERHDERRGDRPQHPADVLADGDAADDARHEDGRLRQRRHLVAHVGPGDDGAGGDRRRHAEDRGHPDEGHAERARRRPRAPGDRPDGGADHRDGGVEDRRSQHRDPVGHDGRDRPGHVPRADQGADGEEDEDRTHRRRDPADGGVAERRDPMAVLEGDEGGERRRWRAAPPAADRWRRRCRTGRSSTSAAAPARSPAPGRRRSSVPVVRARRPCRSAVRRHVGRRLPDGRVGRSRRVHRRRRDRGSGRRRLGRCGPVRRGRRWPPRRRGPRSVGGPRPHASQLRSDRGPMGRSCSGRHRDPCRARSPRSR